MKKIEIINLQHLARLFMVFGMLVFANVPAATKDFTLHQAVLDDDSQLVVRLLNKGAAIDVIGSRKYGYGSALHLAVREGNLEIAKLLLNRGAEVDVLDPDDFTALHNAAWNGNLEMTVLLLDAGADINAVTYDGDTPLSLAQKNEQAQVAEFIQIRLQASLVVDTKVESAPVSDPGVIDISGTYVMSDFTGSADFLRLFVRDPKPQDIPEFTIVQKGNQITGTYDDGRGKIWGDIEGNKVNFEWFHTNYAGIGKWELKPGSNEAVVIIERVKLPGSGNGKFTLTKFEGIDISGTYIADFSASTKTLRATLTQPFSEQKQIVIIVQNGRYITGTFDDGSGKLSGKITGDTITFYYRSRASAGDGNWKVKPGGNEITGTFTPIYDGLNLDPGEWNLTKVEEIDISGTYSAEITHKNLIPGIRPIDYFGRQPNVEVEITQIGNAITGLMSGDLSGSITGAVKGKEITFEWRIMNSIGRARYGVGKWAISDDHNIFNGTWTDFESHHADGDWNLTKIEEIDISGTYSADVTGDTERLFQGAKKRTKFVVKIIQKGGEITGSYGDSAEEQTGGIFWGELEGETIKFSWQNDEGTSGGGKWTINRESNQLTGIWNADTWYGDGKWNLTRIE